MHYKHSAFAIDVETCPFCGGKTKMLSAIHDEASIARILNHVGLDPTPSPIKPARQIVIGFKKNKKEILMIKSLSSVRVCKQKQKSNDFIGFCYIVSRINRVI